MNIKFLDNSVSLAAQRETWILDLRGFKALQIVNIYMEGVPPILAMILAEEKHNYMTFTPTASLVGVNSDEKEFYEKWKGIVAEQLSGNGDVKFVERAAHYTACYGLSIFSPTLNVLYSLNVSQLECVLDKIYSYIKNFNYIEQYEEFDSFHRGLMEILDEFYSGLNRFVQGHEMARLNFFAPRLRSGEFGENYAFNYRASFRYLMYNQLKLDSLIKYEIQLPKKDVKTMFYVPELFAKNNKLKNEWKKDLNSFKDRFPQAFLLDVSEKGDVDALLKKCKKCINNEHEETIKCLKELLKKYVKNTTVHRPFLTPLFRPFIVKIEEMEKNEKQF